MGTVSVEPPYLRVGDPEFEENPTAVVARLRERSWYALTDRGYAFYNTDDLTALWRNPEFKFSHYFLDGVLTPDLAERFETALLVKHGDEHRRLRALVAVALRTRVVESLRASVRQIVRDLIDQFPREGEVDLIEGLTMPLPARVIGPMLGVPAADVDMLEPWITASLLFIDPARAAGFVDDMEAGWRSLDGYMYRLLAEREHHLGDDIFSELIRAEVDGDRLTRDEVVGLATELVRAGFDTTRGQLALTLEALLTHPDQWHKLQADPALAPAAVEEGLRYSSYTTVLPLEATTELEYRGLRFEKGTVALLVTPGGNHDPAKFERPDVFDISRPPGRHYTFGFGIHACIGAAIARLEMVEALTALTTELRECELVEPIERIRMHTLVPKALRVRVVRG